MLDRPDFYNKNILETFYDPPNRATWDVCNICGEVVGGWDVSGFDGDATDGYFVEDFDIRDNIGANDIDEEMEDDSIAHVLTNHEAEVTLVSMDCENEELLRRIIGDKAVSEV